MRKAVYNQLIVGLITGVFAMALHNGGRLAFGRQPPPAYVPPYGEDFVLKRLMKTAYGKVLRNNKVKVLAASLRGSNYSEEYKQVTLDLGLQLARTPLGVRYTISHSVGVDWRTGDILRPEETAQDLLEILYGVSNATARAEMLSEVEQFVREHRRRHRIEAVVRPHGGECYYIAYDVSFSKKDPSGEALILHICGKGEVEDMRRVYVSKDGERREVKLR